MPEVSSSTWEGELAENRLLEGVWRTHSITQGEVVSCTSVNNLRKAHEQMVRILGHTQSHSIINAVHDNMCRGKLAKLLVPVVHDNMV